MSGNPGLLLHSFWCLERCLSGACVRGWLGTLLLIWALGLGAPGDALPVDLETDLAIAEAGSILKHDLGGRGRGESLVGAGHGRLGTNRNGDSPLGRVHGVRRECCPVQ